MTAGPAAADRALVQAYLDRRELRAFDALYDRHTPRLYRLALRLTGGEEAAAMDLVHDAWVRAAERLDLFAWRSALGTWLAGIVVNVAREWSRDRGRTEPLPEEDVGAGGDDRRLSGTVDRVDLERAVAALAPGYRDVLVLHDVEGYTHGEIGSLLGIEAGTSKSQLSRARSQLRRALGG